MRAANIVYFFLELPLAFKAAVHGVVTQSDLVTGVRTTMRAGGCTCSRGSLLAACLGAQVSFCTWFPREIC